MISGGSSATGAEEDGEEADEDEADQSQSDVSVSGPRMIEGCVKSACEGGSPSVRQRPFPATFHAMSSPLLVGSTLSLHPLTISINKSAFVTFQPQLTQHLNIYGIRVAPVMLSSNLFFFFSAPFHSRSKHICASGGVCVCVSLMFDGGVAKLIY